MTLRLALPILALRCALPAVAQTSRPFTNPQRVTILGYTGDAMEPFLSRDGHYLLFNNLNEPNVNTDLFYAERIDDLHFQFRGELHGINTPALEAVASLDRDGNFYFVSNRSYDTTASTLYRGHFDNGNLTHIELVPGVSLAKPGIVNFDAESAPTAAPSTSSIASSVSSAPTPNPPRILLAHRSGDTFIRDPASDTILRTINADGLSYAPAPTSNELKIFFTHSDPQGPAIYRASRPRITDPSGSATRSAAITGFVEAPTLSPDGNALYFHKKEAGHFVLYRVTC